MLTVLSTLGPHVAPAYFQVADTLDANTSICPIVLPNHSNWRPKKQFEKVRESNLIQTW